MAQDIKISTSFDQQSFRQATNALQSLITTVEKLNKSLEGVSRSVAKIQTGGTQAVSTQRLKTQQKEQKGGIVGAILGTSDSSSVGRMVNEADRAFENVSRKIRSFTDRAVADMKRINSAAGRDAGWFGKGTNAIEDSRFLNGGPVPALGPDTIRQMPGPKSGVLSNGVKGLGSFFKSLGPAAVLGGAAGLIMSGVGSVASGDPNQFMNSIPMRAMGISQGYNFANSITAMGANVYNANQQFAVSHPISLQQNIAGAISPFRAIANAGIGKNYASMLAWKQVFARPDIMKAVSDVRLNKETIATAMEDRIVNGRMKELWSRFQRAGAVTIGLEVSDWATKEAEAGRSIPDADLKSMRALERQLKQEQLMSQRGQALNDAHAAVAAQMNPYTSLMVNEIGQNYIGRYRTLAGAGLRTGIIRRPGQPDMTSYEYYEAQARRQGFTNADRPSNYQQVLGIGRGYNRIFGGFTLLKASIGGFGNLGEIAKTAGMIGGSVDAGKHYSLGLAQHTVGRGGIDVAVGRDLYGSISKAALGTGMYNSENLNWSTQNMAAMVYGGGQDVAGQQRSLYGFQIGNELNQTYTSGSRSPLHRLIAVQSAIAATGNKWDGAAIDLLKIGNDPRLLNSLAAGGKIPGWADASLTKEMIQAHQAGLRRGKFAEVVDSVVASSDPTRRALAKELRENQNDPNLVIGKYMRRFEEAGGKKGSRGWMKQAGYLSEKFGGMLPGQNPQANAGLILEDFLSTEGLKAPRGKGAWMPGISGLEAAAAKNDQAIEQQKGIAGGSGEVRKGVTEAEPANVSVVATRTIKGFTSAINLFDAGLDNFKAAIDKIRSEVYHDSPRHAKGPTITPLP